MTQIRFIAAVLLSVLAVPFALASPAGAASRSYTVVSFDRIRVDGPYAVSVSTNVSPFARASGSPSGIDSVLLEVQGRTLIVRLARSGTGNNSAGPVTIAVGTPGLNSAALNGSGSLDIDKVRGLSFDLSVQGAGSAKLRGVAVDRLTIGLVGAATASVSGKALAMKAVVSGASSLDASGLAVRDGVIAADGPAVVKAAISGTAKINSAGVAAVVLSGRPACTLKAVGSSTVGGCR